MWLDKVHQDYFNHKWGQTLLDFPSYPKKLFKQIFPHHLEHEYPSWKQIIDLREAQCCRLIEFHKKNKIILHDFRSASMRDFEEKKLFSLTETYSHFSFMMHDRIVVNLEKNNLGLIVNYLSCLRDFDDPMKKLGFKLKPHTRLYYQPASEAPKEIVIHGYGLSAVWIKKHFPNSRLFVVTDDRDATLPKVPLNNEVNYADISLIYYKDLEISDECYEMQYYLDKVLPSLIDNELKKNNVYVSGLFFDKLEEKIKQLNNVLPRDKEIQMYEQLFILSNPEAGNTEIIKFKKVISDLQERCEERFTDSLNHEHINNKP